MTHKLTEQELQTIKELETSYAQLTTEFGRIQIEKLLVEKQLSKLNELHVTKSSEYEALRVKEDEFVKSITEKYGPGTLNLETGEIVVADDLKE